MSTESSQSEVPEPRVTIEMCGGNLVIRATRSIDDDDATVLVDAVNAAAATNTAVVIDPPPVRCDDVFAAMASSAEPRTCHEHDACEPVDVEAMDRGMIRIPAERTFWTVDLRGGRFCQTVRRTDSGLLGPSVWTPVIAIMVTPQRLTALTSSGTTISTTRAHHGRAPSRAGAREPS